MDIFVSIILGVIGSVLGAKIPAISARIIKYKKRKINTSDDDIFLYSKWLKMVLCAVSGAVWMLAVLCAGNILIGILIAIQITIGIIVAYIDVSIRIIPNELVLTLIIVGIIFQILLNGFKSLGYAIISMIVMMAVFLSVAGFVGLGKVGAGDVKLAGVMGMTLGYPLIITAVFVMSIVLLVFTVAGLLMKKIYLSSMLPLAPFMISGYLVALISLII